MNCPTLQGGNPKGWEYKCERFFKYSEVLELEKIGIASIYLQGKALDCSRVRSISQRLELGDIFYQNNHMIWQGTYGNPISQITKLRQALSIHIFQEQFEALMVRTIGLTKDFFVQCFINGLRDSIKNQVMMFQPAEYHRNIP